MVVLGSCNRRHIRLVPLVTKQPKEFVMRNMVSALAAAALVAPTFLTPTSVEAKRVYKEWRGKDGRLYCRRTDGTTGLIIGGVGGALLGRTIDTRGDRTLGTLGGAAAGALLGREIDREGSKRKCVAR
jgi:uncharacterized protein YcfJ